jgi:hypothetical protein
MRFKNNFLASVRGGHTLQKNRILRKLLLVMEFLQHQKKGKKEYS